MLKMRRANERGHANLITASLLRIISTVIICIFPIYG